MNERPLYSVEAEQAVIGGLLLNNAAYESISDVVAEADFWSQVHRVLWRHTTALLNVGKQADVITLSASLEASNEIELVGVEYLGAIIEATPSAANIKHYAALVRERRLERDLVAAADKLTELAHGTEPVAERLDAAQRLVFELAEGGGDDEPHEIRDVLSGFLEDLEKRMELDGALSGISTGLKDVDEHLDGLQRGDLIIVGGRPSMGKTSLAAQIADDAALGGSAVMAFTMEMSKSQWAQRSISRIGRVDSHKLRSGKLDSDDWERVSSAVGRLHDRKIVIDDRAGLSVDRMRARARRVKRKQGLDLVVIDYLQLMNAAGDNRNEQLSAITRGLKLMARELDCAVVLLSQLSRECDKRPNKRPMMSDLRDSGSIEQDADVIIFVYRDEVYHPETDDRGTAELIIAKCRMGAIGTVRAAWLAEYTAFGNWAGSFEPRVATPKRPPPNVMED